MPPNDYSYEFFQVSFPAEYVAHVEIDRPQKLNSFKPPMWQYLGEIFNRLSVDDNVRCIILSGKGERSFTAGLDIDGSNNISDEKTKKKDAARTSFAMKRYILGYQEAVTPIEKCEKPVICVMHGYSFGAAVDISTACDIRICAEGTKFSVKEVDIGLAADVGTLTRLPKCGVPLSWVKDIAYTARVFGPEEALRMGFVSHVAPSKEDAVKAALARAVLISEKSPVAVQGTKNILNYSIEHSTSDGLMYTAVWNSVMLQTDDVKNAMTAALKKKKIAFEKL